MGCTQQQQVNGGWEMDNVAVEKDKDYKDHQQGKRRKSCRGRRKE